MVVFRPGNRAYLPPHALTWAAASFRVSETSRPVKATSWPESRASSRGSWDMVGSSSDDSRYHRAVPSASGIPRGGDQPVLRFFPLAAAAERERALGAAFFRGSSLAAGLAVALPFTWARLFLSASMR